MKIEEIVTGIWSKGKTIQVGFSVFLTDKYLSIDNPNYEKILCNSFEAIIKQKEIILEVDSNRIINIELTNNSSIGFENKFYKE